jgi:NADPH:quinone reductase-like Zn-dependent oxidoreductase
VVDYVHEDFTRTDERYDLLLDVASTRSWAESRRVLKPDATHVLVGAPKRSKAFGPLGQVARMFVAGKLRGPQKLVFFVAKINKSDLNDLRVLMDSRKVTPLIDRTYPLDRISEAFDYLGEGHARAKVGVTV